MEELRYIQSFDMLTILLGSCLLLLLLLKIVHSVQFNTLITLSWLSKRNVNNQRLSELPLWGGFNFGLLIVQAIIFGLLCYFFIEKPLLTNIRIGWFLLYASVYLAMVILKTIVDTVIARLIRRSEVVRPFIYFKISFLTWSAFIVFLLILVYNYTSLPITLLKISVLVTLGVLSLTFLIVTWRKYKDIAFEAPYYFILYFCALEIAPYYILYKTVAML